MRRLTWRLIINMKKLRRYKKKLHNIVLKTTTVIAAILFMLSICALDSNSCVPFVSGMISLSWIALIAYANGLMTVED